MAKQVTVSVKGDSKNYQNSIKDASKANDSFADSVDKVQKASAIAFGATTAVIGLAIAKFAEFEAEFGNLTQSFIEDGELQEEALADLKEAVFDISSAYGFAATEIAAEMKNLIDSGLEVDEATKLLNESAKISIVTGQELATVNNNVAQAYRIYGSEIDDVTQISDVLFALNRDGTSSFADMEAGMAKALNSGKSLGITFEETAAVTAFLRDQSVEAGKGFNVLAKELIDGNDDIADVSAEAAQALSKQSIEQNGLIESMRRAEAALNAQGTSLKDFINTGNAGAAVTALLANENGGLDAALASVSDRTKIQSDLTQTLEQRQAETAQATKQAQIAFDNVAILLGEQLTPLIQDVTKFLQEFAIQLQDPEFIEFAAKVLKITAAVSGVTLAITTGIKAIGLFKGAWVTAMNLMAGATKLWTVAVKASTVAVKALNIAKNILLGPLGLALTAITALVAAFTFWKSGSDDATEATDKLTKSLDKNAETTGESGKALEDGTKALEAHTGAIEGDTVALEDNTEGLKDNAKAAGDNADSHIDADGKIIISSEERTKKLKDIAEQSHADLIAIEKAKQEGLSSAQIRFLKREQELIRANADLDLMERGEEFERKRELLLQQAATLKADQLAALEDDEVREREKEIKLEHDEEMRELELENTIFEAEMEQLRREGIEEAELEFLQKQHEIDQEAKKLEIQSQAIHDKLQLKNLTAAQKAELQAQQKQIAEQINLNTQKNLTLKQDQENFQNDQLTETEKFFNSVLGIQTSGNKSRVNDDRSFQQEMGSSLNSALSERFDTGKAATLATIGKDTAQAIAAANAIGFPANIAPIAKATSIGAAQTAAAKGFKFQRGGFVSGGTAFDSVPALVRPGEFIAPPQDAEAAALGVARGRGMIGNGDTNISVDISIEGSVIGGGDEQQLAEDLAEIIIPEIRNQQEFQNAEELF